jgi:hypothetical protein
MTTSIAVAVALTLAGQAGSSIEVAGPALQAREVTRAELEKLPQQTVEGQEGGRLVRFSGPLLSDVLQLAGVTFGQTLRGPRLAEYVLVEAADGYSVVYAMAELDAQLTGGRVILALAQEGGALADDDGPFRIVAASHVRHARWVRQVTRLLVMRAERPSP